MAKYSNEEVVDKFLDNIRYLKIAHHVKGRVRVKASLSGARKLAREDTSDFGEVIDRIPGIDKYRMNKMALSLVVDYDPSVLPFELWEEVGGLAENPANREEVKNKLLNILGETA
ncbi:MAG: hypothetical protein CSB24_02890 [Deltaproteobacteria bacterium]|nr:MAG: hypothetical protein CSB24_02890 [Deltaproteobacteria bacterium]